LNPITFSRLDSAPLGKEKAEDWDSGQQCPEPKWIPVIPPVVGFGRRGAEIKGGKVRRFLYFSNGETKGLKESKGLSPPLMISSQRRGKLALGNNETVGGRAGEDGEKEMNLI